MPRVPEVAISQVPLVGSPGPSAEQVRRAGEDLARPVQIFLREQAVITRRRLMTDATSAVVREMNEAHLEAENVDPAVMLDTYDTRVGRAVEKVRTEVLNDDPGLLAEFDARVTPSVQASRFGVMQRQRSRQNDALVASAQAMLLEAERAVGIDPEGQSALIRYEVALSHIRSLPIDETKKVALIEGSQRRVDATAAAGRIFDDPTGFLAETADVDDFSAQYPNMGADDWVALRQKAESRQIRMLENADRFRREQQRQAFDEFFPRLYDLTDPEGMPTMAEVSDSDLSPSAKVSAARIIQNAQAGGDPDPLNEALVVELTQRVWDPSRSDHITDPEALVPFLGNGLPYESFKKLDRDVKKLNEPEQRRVADLRAALVKAGIGQIDGSTFARVMPVGKKRAYEFQQEFDRLWEDGLQRGVDPMKMLDPNDPEYLGRIIPQFVPGAQDLNESLLELTLPRTSTPTVEPRREGETLPQWLERTGRAP